MFLEECSLFVIEKECVAIDYADPLMSHVWSQVPLFLFGNNGIMI